MSEYQINHRKSSDIIEIPNQIKNDSYSPYYKYLNPSILIQGSETFSNKVYHNFFVQPQMHRNEQFQSTDEDPSL